MNIKFSPEELNFIQQVLGELPTKTGAFMVLQSINAQVAEQQQSKDDAPATPE
jgi:hypothetical protein